MKRGAIFCAVMAVGMGCGFAVGDSVQIVRVESQGTMPTYSYDDVGSASASTSGNVTTYTYDSQAKTTDQGSATTYSYDAVGRAGVDSSTVPPTYSYDDHDAGDVNGADDTKAGDTYAQVQGGATTYQYDHASEEVTNIDALGHTTQNSYDAMGRVVGQLETDGTNSTRTTYDDMNRVITMDDELSATSQTDEELLNSVEFTVPAQYRYDVEGTITVEGGGNALNDDLELSLFDITTNTLVFDTDIHNLQQGGLGAYLTPSDLLGILQYNNRYRWSMDLDVHLDEQFKAELQLDLAPAPMPVPAASWGGVVLLGGVLLMRAKVNLKIWKGA